MTINIQNEEVQTRENRLGAITGYKGSIKDLVEQVSCGTLRNKERCFSQTSNCSSGCAQGQLASIKDAAVVNHGPLGCSGEIIGTNVQTQMSQTINNLKLTTVNVLNTNMSENATVFGGAEELRLGVREAYRRFKPKAIFVTTSCVSGIIGDDVKSILAGLEEELAIPVVPVICEGFRSKVWASGFDAAFHAVLTRIVKPPEKKRPDLVNLITFRSNLGGLAAISKILARLGLVPQFVLADRTIEELSRLSEAAATISICGTLGGYLGNGLEQHYGVSFVKSLQPHGIAGMDSWLRELGKVVGKEKEVEAYIAEEKERISPELEEIRKKLKGKTAVIGMGPSFSHSYIRVLQELGVEILWAAAWHFDQHYDHGSTPEATLELAARENDISISVADQQNFEMLNLLKKLKPDIYVSRHPGLSVWSIKLGIPSLMVADVYTALGYEGTVEFGYRILETLANNSLARNLSKRITLPYRDWWFTQDSFNFLEDEVFAKA